MKTPLHKCVFFPSNPKDFPVFLKRRRFRFPLIFGAPSRLLLPPSNRFLLFLLPGKEFPNSFESLVKKICRYLFHVLAHLYWAHFKETVALDLQGHLNTLFAHFVVFVREFNLVDPKETCIMDDLSEVLCNPAPLPAPSSAPSPSSQNHVTER